MQKTNDAFKARTSAATIEKAAMQDDLLAGRLAYDQLYGQKNRQISRLWKAIYALIAVILLASIWLFLLGKESKVLPIVVKVDGHNQILDIQQANTLDYRAIKPYMATYLIEQFIQQVRGVSIDGQLENHRLKSAYAMTQGIATHVLEDFLTLRNPIDTAAQEVITVQIDNILPDVDQQKNITQVEWTEIARAPKTGKVLNEKKYTGQFAFNWRIPATQASVVQYNPLGFYITHITWSENVESEIK